MDWQIWLIIGVLIFILEIFTPYMFFINLAVAALLTAIPSFFGLNLMYQTAFFGILSVLLILFLRPLLIGRTSSGTGVHEKYVGSVAKSVTDISDISGRISVYGEEWDARTERGGVSIPANVDVVITTNKGTVMFVKSLGEK